MICPKCGKNSKVLESRPNKDGSTKRRYECQNLHRFTTINGVLLTDEAKHEKQRANALNARAARQANKEKQNDRT